MPLTLKLQMALALTGVFSGLVCGHANAATEALAVPESFGVWSYSKLPDPMTTGEIALATVDVDGGTAMVRCWTNSGELDLRIQLSAASGKADSEYVQLGFDQGSDVEREWRLGPAGLALIVPALEQNKMLRKLRSASAMRLGFARKGVGSLPQDSVVLTQLDIPLSGSSKAIGRVLRDCH